MKNFLIILVLLVAGLSSCKKDKDAPEPVTPDYADGMVGTYLGQEIYLKADNYTQVYNNGSKTVTVVKLDKNKIQINTFYAGSGVFTLSDNGNGNIKLTPLTPFVEYGVSNNNYYTTSKQLNVYVKDALNKYIRYQGTKQ